MAIFEEIAQLEQEEAAFGLQWEIKDQIITQIRKVLLLITISLFALALKI